MSSPDAPSIWKIPDLVNSIMKSVRQVTQMFLDSKEPALDGNIGKEQDELEIALQEEGAAVATYFNHYLLVLGTEFSSGDDDSIRELSMVFAALPQDDVEVKELRNQQRGFSESERLEFMKRLKSEVIATKRALQQLARRKGFSGIHDLRGKVRKLFPMHGSNAKFCEGALHLQKHASAPLSVVASGEPGGGGFICHHCNLDLRCMEIDKAGTITFTEAEWRTLAACHMRAHFSFQNLAAWYLCRVCHEWGVEPPEVFVSPVAMMEHLKSHRSTGVEQTQKVSSADHLVRVIEMADDDDLYGA